MSLTADGIMSLDGQLLPFSRDLREALGLYARRRWPVNTSGHAARAWSIPKTTAANLLKGHASDATVTKIIRAGGWELALPVIGAVIGEPVHAFFRDQMRQAAKEAERALEHERLASTAYRRLAGHTDRPGDAGDAAEADGKAGRGAGALGHDEARGLADEGLNAPPARARR